eukprot:UN04866
MLSSILLRLTLLYSTSRERQLVEALKKEKNEGKAGNEPLFLCVQTKSVCQWNFLELALKKINSNYEVLDFRLWHGKSGDKNVKNQKEYVFAEFYLQSEENLSGKIELPAEETKQVNKVVGNLFTELNQIQSGDHTVRITRWLPSGPVGTGDVFGGNFSEKQYQEEKISEKTTFISFFAPHNE